MQVRDFKDSELLQLNHWLAKHRQAPIPKDAVPKLTFIVPGVAIASIRLIEGGAAFMDNLVTNPHASSSTRHNALNALYSHIKLKTEQLNIKRLFGMTVDAGSHSRAIEQGFKPMPHACLVYTKES
jgi:hypothetical protein